MSICQNIFQQVFCLSTKICSAAKDRGSAKSLAATLKSNLESLYANADFANGDRWSTSWGPVVWQAPFSNVADQAVAVCFNETQKFYVVAIAATNPNSLFDGFEDLAASPLHMQPLANPPGGSTTAGNWVALQAILTQMMSAGQPLGPFLKGVASADATLVFCGHSLGGGLAPLAAASLYPTGTASSGWKNVYTYGSAGPATADSTFAAAFNKAFPATAAGQEPYAVWNANQYNLHDVVPNAWAPGKTAPGLAQITASTQSPTEAMFYTNPLFMLVVAALRTMTQSLASYPDGRGNPYVALNNNPFFTGARQAGQITSSTLLEKEILYQHIQAYLEAFGVTGLFPAEEVNGTIRPPLLTLARTASAACVTAEATTCAAP
ncbi:Lipase (class 3) [Stigmatella aurantiaca]|uniref:Lipase (Class 3) n=1 Tax=Stigmatella aurantiaca TaxID=41 RepID=A0A1H7QFJ4_STIAU|nr:hypothetical protein [Stigmatella aurantiaca]SEL46067.1 Lipase (class 3) [Stigmatella aurantiaca]